MPVGKLVKIGAWENDQFIGVIIFGNGACDALGLRFDLTVFQTAEMVRVAFSPTHPNRPPISRIISIALRLLKKQCPGIRAVVSFSDPEAGHIGTIYQAMGWIYTGTTAAGKMYQHKITGEILHSRFVSASGFKKTFGGRLSPCTKTTDCIPLPTCGKHRYFWTFDAEIKQRIMVAEGQPYPKKESGGESISSNASVIQADQDGATPISPLHSSSSKKLP